MVFTGGLTVVHLTLPATNANETSLCSGWSSSGWNGNAWRRRGRRSRWNGSDRNTSENVSRDRGKTRGGQPNSTGETDWENM